MSSLSRLLSSSRAEIPHPLMGCLHPTSAVTLCNRNQSPDGGGRHPPLLTSVFTLTTLLMTSLTTLLQKLHAASSSSEPLFYLSKTSGQRSRGKRLISGALASSVPPTFTLRLLCRRVWPLYGVRSENREQPARHLVLTSQPPLWPRAHILEPL